MRTRIWRWPLRKRFQWRDTRACSLMEKCFTLMLKKMWTFHQPWYTSWYSYFILWHSHNSKNNVPWNSNTKPWAFICSFKGFWLAYFQMGLLAGVLQYGGYSQNLYLSVRAEGAYCCGLVSERILCLRFGGLKDCFKVLRMLKYDYFFTKEPTQSHRSFLGGVGRGVIFGRVF